MTGNAIVLLIPIIAVISIIGGIVLACLGYKNLRRTEPKGKIQIVIGLLLICFAALFFSPIFFTL